MPKVGKTKFFAVVVGWDAPGIYTTWEECSKKVSRYPNALHRSFKTRQEAEQWIESKADITALHSKERSQVVARGTRNLPILIDHEDEPRTSTTSIVPHPHNTPEQSVVLSKEQSRIYARVREGKNVFFTGSAGTGKSVLLREIIKLKRNLNGNAESSPAIAITASTGIAALNIGGVTLHSWAGIKLGQESVKGFIAKARRSQQLLDRWQRVEMLIIDELSMIDGSLFDYLEEIARGLRRSESPFGGIQLVLCGDFCQLPPVPGKDQKGHQIPVQFAFEARTWNSCIGTPMMLRKVFRQNDQTFANMLNEMRYGGMQDSTVQIFKSLSRSVSYTDGIVPTEIYPTRREVANANDWRLGRLPGIPQIYEAQDTRGVDHKGELIQHERMLDLLDKLIAPKRLELKVGAQVMLIKNLVQGVLVNGSVGQIIRFDTPREASASGTSVAVVDTGKNKDEGQDYHVVTSKILEHDWKWPVVRFTNGMELIVTPHDFTINNGDGETMMAKRLQLPLILAWALSVHKSQGQTLERVRVDLRRTFEKGQAYVALSRATTMEHLQVLNFSKEKIMAHPRVLVWYGETVNDVTENYIHYDNDELMGSDRYHCS